jgi:syringate O-demethylase/vanillate/3-O-methylgallate O-demethylase
VLEAVPEEKRRKKVTLVWNRDDVAKIFASQLGDGPRYKALDLPVAYYGWPQFDEVRTEDGVLVGHSCHCGYSANEGKMLSLAMLEASSAAPGTHVVLTWGEPGGGSRKPHVERHEQIEVRATVAPVPYAQAVQKVKRTAIS